MRWPGCLQSAVNLKHRAALSVAYGAGLRASEVVHLKVSDIDSQRRVIRVEQGKGRRDRYAMLSPALLKLLRQWWCAGRAQGKMLPQGWLFPGLNPVNPLSTRQLNRACKLAAAQGGVRQAGLAAHLKTQLCHAPFRTTGRYPHHSSSTRASEAGQHRAL